MLIGQLEYILEDNILTQRTLRLRIGVEDIRRSMDSAARALRDKGETVPGFRKGKGPLALYLKHFRARVEAEAFEELRRAAVQQVLKLLPEKDQPLLPPEVLKRDTVHLSYNRPLEFAVKYLVDPSGISKNPEQPNIGHGAAVPGHQLQRSSLSMMGIPQGPALPQAPQPMQAPALPAMPQGAMQLGDVPSGEGMAG